MSIQSNAIIQDRPFYIRYNVVAQLVSDFGHQWFKDFKTRYFDDGSKYAHVITKLKNVLWYDEDNICFADVGPRIIIDLVEDSDGEEDAVVVLRTPVVVRNIPGGPPALRPKHRILDEEDDDETVMDETYVEPATDTEIDNWVPLFDLNDMH